MAPSHSRTASPSNARASSAPRHRVYDAVVGLGEPVSTSRVAQHLGLNSRQAAQHHLDRLVSDGYLTETRDEHGPGGKMLYAPAD